MRLYRFQAINKLTIQNLAKQKNWIADPYNFNDPFEFSLCDGFFLEAKGFRKMNRTEMENTKKIQDTVNKFGVVCYSVEPINNLLWAHYADCHKGMCLVFDVPKGKEGLLNKVKYQLGFPKIDLSNEAKKDEEFRKIVVTKSKEWEYENEYRQIFYDKNIHYEYPGNLVEIIFACRTPIEDIKMVTSIATNNDQNIIISKMHIDQFQYKLLKSTIGKNREIPKLWDTIGMRI